MGLVHDIAAIQATVFRGGRERLGLCPGFILARKAPVVVFLSHGHSEDKGGAFAAELSGDVTPDGVGVEAVVLVIVPDGLLNRLLTEYVQALGFAVLVQLAVLAGVVRRLGVDRGCALDSHGIVGAGLHRVVHFYHQKIAVRIAVGLEHFLQWCS